MRRVDTAPAHRLGLVRLLVGGYTLRYLWRQRDKHRRLSRTDPAHFAPVGPVRVLRRPLPAPVADALTDATLGTTALFALGAGHRLVGPLHSALLTWTLSYRNSWSMVFHSDNTLVLHTWLLGASRAADAASLDALISRAPGAGPSPRYGWPLQAMQAVSTATYLISGVAKVAGPSGWAWVDGGGMRRQVAIDRIRKDVYGSSIGSDTAHALYPHRHLFTAFAVGTLVLELGAPVALAHPRLGRSWALSAYGMHWGIRAIMGIRFRYQLSGVSFASWFALERVLARFRRP